MRPPLHRRKWLLVALLFVTTLTAYSQFGLAPGRLKQAVIRKIEARSAYKVDFSRILYLPFEGLSIHDLKITDKHPSQSFTAKKLVIKIKLLPLIFERKYHIDRVRLDRALFDLTLKKGSDGGDVSAILFPALAALSFKGLNYFLPENIALNKLEVRNATVDLLDVDNPGVAFDKITRLNLEVDYRKQPFLLLKGGLHLGNPGYAKLLFDGKWQSDKSTAEIQANGSISEIPEWLNRFVTDDSWDIRKLNTRFQLNVQMESPERVAYQLVTNQSTVSIDWTQYQLTGSVSLHLKGVHDSASDTMHFEDSYMDIEDATLKGLPEPVLEFQHIKGRLFFEPNRVRFDRIESSWQNTQTVLRGSLDLTPPLFFDVQIQQKTDRLILLETILPEQVTSWLEPSAFRGRFDIDARLIGDLVHPAKLKKTIKMDIRDGEWKPQRAAVRIAEINGSCLVMDERIEWSSLKMLVDKNRISAEGVVDFTPNAPSSVRIRHPQFSVESNFVAERDAFDIRSLTVNTKQSRIQLNGKITNTEPFSLRLEGKSQLDLQELKQDLGKDWTWLAQMNPKGKADVQIQIESKRGLSADALNFFMKSDLDTVTLYDRVTAEDVNMDLQYQSRRLKITYGKSRVYQGEMRFQGDIDFLDPKHPLFDLHVWGSDLKLAEVGDDFDLLPKDISGALNLEMDLKGALSGNANVNGTGHFDLREGHLITTGLFHKLRRVLFVTIEGIDNLTFDRADGNFTVADQTIYTEDTQLSSNLVTVGVSGRIGFDKTLSLNLRPRFTNDLIKESYEVGGSRIPRESSKGKVGGRTHEIQRLIGRSLRSVVDFTKLGERTFWVDCDVLQGDGGTRCASITGSYIALHLACQKLVKQGVLTAFPLKGQVAAVSVGIVKGQPMLDLCYEEDSTAEVDMNIVMTDAGKFIEVQGTAESEPFSDAEMKKLVALAKSGIAQLFQAQRKALRLKSKS